MCVPPTTRPIVPREAVPQQPAGRWGVMPIAASGMLWNDMVKRRPRAANFCWGDTMTMYGADVSQLRELAKAVDKAASLLSCQGNVAAGPDPVCAVEEARTATVSARTGPAATAPAWNASCPACGTTPKSCCKHADEQEKASHASSGRRLRQQRLGQAPRPWPARPRTGCEEQAAEGSRSCCPPPGTRAGPGQDAGRRARRSRRNGGTGLSAEDRQYLIEGEGEDGPFAEDLMRMDGGIPESAQEQAKQHLQELAKADIPVYTEIRQGLHRSPGCLGPRRRGGGHRGGGER